jgi:hypothetical protein
MDTKRCTLCGIDKSIIEFHKRTRSPDGLKFRCKTCCYLEKNNPVKVTPKKQVCRTCGETKAASSFCVSSSHKSGYHSSCKDCMRWKDKLNRYGVTKEQYESMVAAQNNLCAICNRPEKDVHQSGRLKSLSIDHCHKTGKVRGLLCFACNSSIGKFDDDVDLLRSAIRYLEKESVWVQ